MDALVSDHALYEADLYTWYEHQSARAEAALETGLPPAAFPPDPPFTLAEVPHPDFRAGDAPQP